MKLYVRDQPEKSFSQRVLENIRNYIITGILIMIPVAITYVLFRWAFYTVDGAAEAAIRFNSSAGTFRDSGS